MLFTNIGQIWDTVISVLLAVTGGLARLLNAKDSEKLKLGKILSELFISGFAGIMVLMLAHASGLSGDWVGLICGISGWIGPRILETITKIVEKATGIGLDEQKDKDK